MLAGDPVAAAEIVAAPSLPALNAIAICLLDADAGSQAARLAARGDAPALLPHHQAFAECMRRQASDPLHMVHVVSDGGWSEMRWERLRQVADRWGTHVIDTSQMTKAEVAAHALQWCHEAIGGIAPSLQAPEP